MMMTVIMTMMMMINDHNDSDSDPAGTFTGVTRTSKVQRQSFGLFTSQAPPGTSSHKYAENIVISMMMMMMMMMMM